MCGLVEYKQEEQNNVRSAQFNKMNLLKNSILFRHQVELSGYLNLHCDNKIVCINVVNNRSLRSDFGSERVMLGSEKTGLSLGCTFVRGRE